MNIKHWLRFVVGGGINTAVTYLVYLGLSLFLSYQSAFLFAYVLGIVIAYGINSRFVFRVPLSFRRFFAYPLAYLLQYGLSAVLLEICVEHFRVSEKLAPLLVTIVMIPPSYIINKLALKLNWSVLTYSGPVASVGIALLLLIQNLLIFRNHYFQGFAFPWDFLGPYHAVPYYWIEAVKAGVGVDWIPFQGMGYPIFMNLQTSLFYPPLWLLAVFNQEYTLTLAVILQCLHVLLAAIGATCCARLMGLSWSAALLAGVFYQGFGAFYSNSEHVDIVRAYALLPWLAAPVFASWTSRSRLHKPMVLVQPLIVYFMWTGGYLGGTIATLFVLGLVLSLRIIVERQQRITGLLILGLQFAGCLLAGAFLVPAALGMSGISRSSQLQQIAYDYLQLKDCFSLIYDVDKPFFGHDLSMRSMFVGLPVMVLLMVGLPEYRRWSRWVAASIAAALVMAGGLLHPWIAQHIPPLGYSRFPMGDYRALIGLGTILLAISHVAELRVNRRSSLGFLVLLVWIVFGNHLMGLDREREAARLYGMLLCLALLFFGVRNRFPKTLVAILIFLYGLDWYLVHDQNRYFNSDPKSNRNQIQLLADMEARPRLIARLKSPQGCRPSRIEVAERPHSNRPWRGYYTGEFMTADYSGPMKFDRQQKIYGDPKLLAFAVVNDHPPIAHFR